MARENKGSQIRNVPFILKEQDVDHLHDQYQISQETFHVFAPSLGFRVNDQIPTVNTIIIYEEQLKLDLRFPMDSFFAKVLRFHKLSVAQLHPNSWRILVAFQFVCCIITSSVALFSQLY